MRQIAFRGLFACTTLGILFSSCAKESKYDNHADTLVIAKIFQPDGLTGKDAIIESISPDQNFGNTQFVTVLSWTNEGSFNTARTLIEFNLSNISPITKIKKARLSLYWTRFENLSEHTGDNAFSIFRIVEKWGENTTNWNNQPLTIDLHAVKVPKSKITSQSYVDIDMTDLVQDIVKYPSDSHGFMLKLDEENPYRLVILASSNCPEKNKRPKLVVFY